MPELSNPGITGVFDHSSQSSSSFADVDFLLSGSNGTVAAISFTDFFTGAAAASDQLIAFEAAPVQNLIIELSPLAILRLPGMTTGISDHQSPPDAFKYFEIEECVVSGTNGTRSAPVIYHNQGSVVLVPAISFEESGAKRVGLLYPRRFPIYRNRSSASTSNSFGFFTMGDFKSNTQKKFFVNQTYPTNLS